MSDTINKFINDNLELCAKASKPPWHIAHQNENDDEFMDIGCGTHNVAEEVHMDDVRFMINSRTALPKALKALEILIPALIKNKSEWEVISPDGYKHLVAWQMSRDALTEIEELLK